MREDTPARPGPPPLAVRVRPARTFDADAAARFLSESFVATFGHLYPVEDLEAFLALHYGEAQMRDQILDPACRLWLAEARPVGMVGAAQAGPMGLPLQREPGRREGEIKRLYVAESVKGRGVAHELMQTMLGWLRGQGVQDVYLSVWADNARARAFYSGYGFEVVGAYRFAVGETLDDERIMRLRLKP
jgi:ribosomal protein S18 acetylase RimI-like enzyme